MLKIFYSDMHEGVSAAHNRFAKVRISTNLYNSFVDLSGPEIGSHKLIVNSHYKRETMQKFRRKD